MCTAGLSVDNSRARPRTAARNPYGLLPAPSHPVGYSWAAEGLSSDCRTVARPGRADCAAMPANMLL